MAGIDSPCAVTSGPYITPRFDIDAEDARALEFYSYYESYTHATQDWKDPHSSSIDPALAAFAQLGAIRLDCGRGIISFFDNHNQYILAEATRTLPLSSGAAQDHGDELWRGPGTYARGLSVCENTANPTNVYGLGDQNEPIVTIIPDLSQHPLYLEKSFVTGRPHARFYAGVPIITAKGTMIGAYCVLDDKPRDGLLPWQHTLLKDLSAMIMTHLEMVRARSVNERSLRMVKGHGRFFGGEAGLSPEQSEKGTQDMQDSVLSARDNITQTNYHDNERSALLAVRHKELPFRNSQPSKDGQTQVPSDHSPAQVSGEEVVAPAYPRSRRSSISSNSTSLRSGNDSQYSDSARFIKARSTLSDIQSAFGRAANIMREAMGVDGALYASCGSFTSPPESGNAPKSPDFTVHVESADDSRAPPADGESPGFFSVSPGQGYGRTVELLGISTDKSGRAGMSRKEVGQMTDLFIDSLLRRYPRGKTWTFRDAPKPQPLKAELVPTATDGNENPPNMLTQRKSSDVEVNRKGWRLREREMLQRMFPGVRSLALIGLWDSKRERWFAASFVWTCNPFRVFSRDVEISYLTAFGNSVMAEVVRLGSESANKAKQDLLSTMSHELRSPLHGILGCADGLADTSLDAFQEGLLFTLETCGRTLLDTIDHLLEFSNIISSDKKNSRTAAWQAELAAGHASSTDVAAQQGTDQSPYDGGVDLAVLVEEVVETAAAGFDFVHVSHGNDSRARAKSLSQDGVIVSLAMARTPETQWAFVTHAGAWRRLILNIVSNSLKFTTRGFVEVRLECLTTAEEDDGRCRVALTVIDSGNGMDEGFLRGGLFVPFQQEDSLNAGTGLGMSITKDIVTKLGGSLRVDSAKDRGTAVEVIIPGLRRVGSAGKSQGANASLANIKIGYKMRINFFGAELGDNCPRPDDVRNPSNAAFRFRESFAATCRDWLGIAITFTEEPQDADIFITTASAAHRIGEDLEKAALGHAYAKIRNRPLLILCNTPGSARRMFREEATVVLSEFSEYVSLPCGPQKLARAISLCFERMPVVVEGTRLDERLRSRRRSSNNSTTTSDASHTRANSTVLDSLFSVAEADPGVEKGDEEVGEDEDVTKGRVNEIRRPSMKLSKSAIATAQACDIDEDGVSPKSAPRNPLPPSGLSNIVTRPMTPPASPSILLVDDNAINLKLLEAYMRKNKFNYRLACNGLEALEAYHKTAIGTDTVTTAEEITDRNNDAQQEVTPLSPKRPKAVPRTRSFQTVLMDISMPVMDGLESTRRIRALERELNLQPAKIVALTALGSAEAKEEAYRCGVDVFCMKPVRLGQLGEILGFGS